MNRTATVLLVLLVLLLVACQDEGLEATEAPEATEAAVEIPEEQASPEPTEAAVETPEDEASSEATEETEAPEPTIEEPMEEAAEVGALPHLEPLDECFVEMPEGTNYECMYVTVPEFHNEDNGRSINLGVIRLLSSADAPAAPVFIAAGGPGGSVMDMAPTTAEALLSGEASVYAELLATRDLVFFTQRGTLYAEPALMCGVEVSKPYVDIMFAGTSVQEREQAETDGYKDCIEELSAAGVDFSAYTSLESAADVDSIRQAFGYDQIVLYGESYGTLLAQHVMRDYPETLAAVILDGAVPISAPGWDTQLDAKFQSALENVIGLCQADAACNDAYPNLSENIEAVYQKLQSEPYAVDLDTTQYLLDENLAALAFYNMLYSASEAANLPLAVDSFLNDTQDGRVLGAFFMILPRSDRISFPMHFAVVCSEDPIRSVEEAVSLDEVYGVVSEYVRSDASRYIEMCSYLDLPTLPAETDAPIESTTPVLLLSGAHDPATPALTAKEILPGLPNSFSFEFPYGGHVQFLSGDACAESIVASFIADPTTEPDSSCIAEALPPEFALPMAQ